MQIDWFTAIAQIVNFLILLALLKHFLFKRIVDAMDRREAKIAGRIDEAQQKQQRADDKEKEFEQKSNELEKRRNKVLSQAREEAHKKKNEMLEGARKDVDEQRGKWLDSLEREREEFLDQLRRRGGSEVLRITERVLDDLAGAELLTAMSDRFVKRLKELPDDQWSHLTGAVQKSGAVAVVSSHEIPDKTRDSIKGILGEHVDGKFDIDYQVDEDMLCGLAVQANGYQLAWSSRDYLDDLRTHLGELLQQRHEQSQQDTESSKSGSEETEESESEPNESDQEGES